MSAELALDRLEIDLEENHLTASLTIDVGELFDENGELRLWEDDDGWSGYVREDAAYYYVNTWVPEDDFLSKVIVGERAVRCAVQERLKDPDIGGVGQFVRGADP